jgi:hypothetical protein
MNRRILLNCCPGNSQIRYWSVPHVTICQLQVSYDCHEYALPKQVLCTGTKAHACPLSHSWGETWPLQQDSRHLWRRLQSGSDAREHREADDVLVSLQIFPRHSTRLDLTHQIQEVQSWYPCQRYSLPYGLHAGEWRYCMCVRKSTTPKRRSL